MLGVGDPKPHIGIQREDNRGGDDIWLYLFHILGNGGNRYQVESSMLQAFYL